MPTTDPKELIARAEVAEQEAAKYRKWHEDQLEATKRAEGERDNYRVSVGNLATELRETARERDDLRCEIDRVLSQLPNAVRVREGGGLENLAASLAVSVERLRSECSEWWARAKAGDHRTLELEGELAHLKKQLDVSMAETDEHVKERESLQVELAKVKKRAERAESDLSQMEDISVKLLDIIGRATRKVAADVEEMGSE